MAYTRDNGEETRTATEIWLAARQRYERRLAVVVGTIAVVLFLVGWIVLAADFHVDDQYCGNVISRVDASACDDAIGERIAVIATVFLVPAALLGIWATVLRWGSGWWKAGR